MEMEKATDKHTFRGGQTEKQTWRGVSFITAWSGSKYPCLVSLVSSTQLLGLALIKSTVS